MFIKHFQNSISRRHRDTEREQPNINTLRASRLCERNIFRMGIIALFVLSAIPVHAQAQWWLGLEQGKQYYRNGAYGNALMAFEDARRARMDRFTRLENDLILVLSTPEYRRFGDSLNGIETYSIEQRRNNVIEILNELYYHYPKELLGGSINRLLNVLDRLKAYPEAEFWIGEVFRSEGETGLALRQYQRAYDERALLQTPGFDVEIMYRIVDMHRIRQERQEMENRALDILRGSPVDINGVSNGVPRDYLWAGESQSFARAAMMRILENEGIGRFLTLYRYSNIQIEKAHRFLGLYYYTSSRHNNAAEHLMFAFLIQNTLLIDEVIRLQFDFTYTNLDNLMESIQRRPELLAYLEQIEYFRTIYYLAASLHATGKQLPARQLWTFLSNRPESGEWQRRSRSQLQNPYIDRAQEMP